MLRSCYTVNMQFDADGTMIRPVRWYFCREGALPLPYSHLYGSANWLTVPRQNTGIGERWDSPRAYNNGQAPVGASGQTGPCGPQDWWENGVPPDAPPLPLDTQLLGTCCTGDTGGIFVGGGRYVPCIRLFHQDMVQISSPLDPTFEVMTEFNAATWRYDYTPQLEVQVFGRTAKPFTDCLNQVEIIYHVGSTSSFRLAVRMSYDPATQTSIWVETPSLGGTPLQGLPISIRIVNRMYAGTGGLKIGGAGVPNRNWQVGTGGLLLGATTLSRLIATLTGGIKVGSTTLRVIRIPGDPNAGIKVGATSTHKDKVTGTGGLKVGATSIYKLHKVGSGGVKIGATSSSNQGIAVLCCPHRVFPTTLYATNGSAHKFTATWDSTNHWWAWTDTDVPHGFHLQCTLVGSTWTWQIRPAAQAGCSSSSTASSVTCGPPMSLSITCTVTGGSCVIAGAYPYTITEV
jgi:hypothetical protein